MRFVVLHGFLALLPLLVLCGPASLYFDLMHHAERREVLKHPDLKLSYHSTPDT